MSNRFYTYDKGSSRSTRDDSRSKTYERQRGQERHGESSKRTTKSRSRSPRSQRSPEYKNKRCSPERRRKHLDSEGSRAYSPNFDKEDSPDVVPAPPPPPRITKISIDFSKTKVAPIKMKLGGPAASTAASKATVASVFNNDDDDEDPEEMPAEARMRMRNIGRETPTSAGPNSFGKTKQGFCDAKKMFEKNLKEAMETTEKPASTKFPQTIYKIKGP